MTEKRFVYYEHKGADYILDTPNVHLDFIEMLGDALTSEEIVDLLNELHEENQWLKQSNEDARHILKREFDFATEQRQKHLDDPVVANAYDIIRFDMRKALDNLGWLE